MQLQLKGQKQYYATVETTTKAYYNFNCEIKVWGGAYVKSLHRVLVMHNRAVEVIELITKQAQEVEERTAGVLARTFVQHL